MKNTNFKIWTTILILIFSVVYFSVKQGPHLLDPLREIDEMKWAEAQKIDPKLGTVPDELRVKIKSEIKIAGFVVPLSDNLKEIREFLLVPDPMACIHVPPPPANQMILVELSEPMNVRDAFGPVWVKGRLSVNLSKTTYGDVAIQMRGDRVKPFTSKNWH